MARYDDLNTKMIGYATVLSIVVLVIVLQGTQALTFNMINSEDAAKERKEASVSESYKKGQLESLHGFNKARMIDESACSRQGAGSCDERRHSDPY